MLTDRLPKAGGGLITLITDNITFTTTDIPSTINTHNIELQMVKVHINNTKHITIAIIYIPPRDTTSTHYITADTDIQHCIQYITTVSNTLYNRTSWTTQHALSSDHLPIITTINIRHDYRLQQNRRTFTNYKKADWTQFTEDTESAFAQTTIPTNIHTANRIFTNITLMADKQNIPKGKMHSNCRLLPEDIVCKITQRNNIRRANTCYPALNLLNEELTSDIQKHKQNMEGALRRSLGSQAQHTHSLEDHTWSIQQSTTTHTKHIHNIQQQNSNYTQHTKQSDTLTEQHTTYKDTTLHSLLLWSKRL